MKKTASKKGILILLLMFLSPFILVSIYTYIYIGFNARNDFYTTMSRFTENTANRAIERPVDEMKQLFKAVSDYIGPQEFKDFIQGDNASLNAIVPTIVNSTGLFNGVVIFDDQDHFKAYPPLDIKEFKPSARPWFKSNLTKGQFYFSKVYPGTSGQKDITVSMNLFSPNYEHFGGIAFNLDLNEMSDALRDVVLPYDARFKVVDKEHGDIILYKNSNQILTRQVPADWLDKATEVDGSFFDKNERKYVFYRTFHNPNWIAFSVVDEQAFNQSMSFAYKTYYVMLVLCFIFYMVIICLVNLYFKRIISKLHMSINGVDDNADNLDKFYREIKQKNKNLTDAVHHSETDALTGIHNRHKLNVDIENHLKNKIQFSLAIIDIDNFKKVNDTYGHDTGDAVLKYVSSSGISVIAATEGANLYRFGGEELVVLFANRGTNDSAQLIDTWRKLVFLKEWREDGLSVSFSGGVATWRDGETAEQLLKRADSRLYQAKNSGKNKIVITD